MPAVVVVGEFRRLGSLYEEMGKISVLLMIYRTIIVTAYQIVILRFKDLLTAIRAIL
jgi:hypothetical protein